MSKIITVTATTTEQAVTFDATYQFAWIRNLSDNDCLASVNSGIVAGADDVELVKAHSAGHIETHNGRIIYIKSVDGTGSVEIHAQNFADIPVIDKAGSGGGQSITVEPLTVTKNDVYTAPTGTAYSPVTVDVQEEPWQPLEDGYSNFWFELTDDTLSPWLNFSAKTNDAVIDWGDGSGEVALDTLTPTHTYSKAGKYVVKVKGVTGIAAQHTTPFNSDYFGVLQYAELNNEVVNLGNSAFNYCTNLKQCIFNNTFNSFGTNVFSYNANLEKLDIPNGVTTVQGSTIFFSPKLKSITFPSTVTSFSAYAMRFLNALKSVTFPASLTDMGNSSFNTTPCLEEIHCLATTPPTLGTTVFAALPTNYVIYVPVGYGDTYKAASGWSDYADHILEEGQTPNRAMVAKFNAMKKEVTDDGSDSNENR